ncbi:MAG TPA: prolipoprotein diacylglyceryl transferase family protein [Candidatus Binatia bacterium]|nr:prolipoprotein diacylglyceryl transferase family protein [Candidatus Binatia bacterium]
MRPVLGHLGPIPIRSFGLMVALAFVTAGALMHRDLARKDEPTDLAWAIVVFALLGGLLGARLNLALEYPAAFAAAPLAFLTSRSGFVWYGGLAGGAVATLWPIHRWRVPWASAADTAAPALALGLAVGRVGCHLAGDGDWGTPSTLPWAVAYTHGVAPWPHPPGVRVHPAALYEGMALAALSVILWSSRERMRRPGTTFAIYLTTAAAIRFLVELVRTNRPIALGLTEAQWVGLAVAAGAGAWLAVQRGPSGARRGSP